MHLFKKKKQKNFDKRIETIFCSKSLNSLYHWKLRSREEKIIILYRKSKRKWNKSPRQYGPSKNNNEK